ncbi:MAG TPA: hypothetical protein VGS03_01020 [Candidatus Polarisedimenticolia bacterium]|nr:hypothetical protein [Candidatus Polarisedimenticolia bacterium]
MKRMGRALLLAALAAEAIYVVPVNIALNTPLRERRLGRHPERFRIDWRLAISPVPGYVYLRGVTTGGQSRAIQWEAHLRSVSATFALPPLRRRVVDLGTVRAAGVRYAQRPRLPPEGPVPPDAAEWPPLGGRANPERSPTEPATPDVPAKAPGSPWTVRARSIRCGVEEIWIGRYRLAGEASADAALDLVTHGPIGLPRIGFRLSSGEMRVGELKMFEGLKLDIRARLDAFTPRGRKAVDVIRALSGEFDLDARDSSLKFLEAYFHRVPGLSLDGGGPMRLKMLIRQGRILTGSRLERSNDRIDTTFLDNRITGSGTVEAEVVFEAGVPTSRVEMITPRYEVTRAGAAAPFAHGEGFHLLARSTNLDLTDPFADVHLTADLEKEEIPDLSVYNAYFPIASRARIESGLGRMSWHFEGDSGERSLHGTMRFDLLDMALKFEDTTLRGDVRIDAVLRNGDPRGRAFDISGTTVSLVHHAPRWRGVIRFPRARLEFTEPMRVDARTTLDLQDTRPLVRVYDAFRDLSPRMERALTIENLTGGTGFVVGPDAVDLRGLSLEGRGLKALGELTLADAGKEGILYIRFHGISFGLALAPGQDKDIKFMRPLAWFERERAARRRRRPASP